MAPFEHIFIDGGSSDNTLIQIAQYSQMVPYQVKVATDNGTGISNAMNLGASMAQEILPKYGYTEQHVKTIVELIHATEIPHKPINKLQEIICDADLDYLGRSDFEQIADNLRKELSEMGKIKSRKEWDTIQVNFLKQHQYFTTTAIESRQKKKQENLEVVLERLAADAYTD
jgi:glycosyltransferase involved in cell wall biosynthesis